MKRIIFLALLVIAVIGPMAQPCRADKPANNPFPSEQVIKEASIYVDNLKLHGDAAEKFTMLYLDYRRKIHNAMEKHKTPYSGSASNLTDQQNDKNIRARFASSKEILDIREQYYPKFLKVMTPTQYEELMKLERKVLEKSRTERVRRHSSSSSSSSRSSNSSKRQSTSSKKKTSSKTSTNSGTTVIINEPMTETTYEKDSSGNTVKKVVNRRNGTTNIYYYDEDGNIIRHIESRNNKSYRKTSSSRTNSNVEIIVGSDGTERTLYYDEDGSVIREIIRHRKNNI